jgi:hypothetical protein
MDSKFLSYLEYCTISVFWFLWTLLVSAADTINIFYIYNPHNKAIGLFSSNNHSVVEKFFNHYNINMPHLSISAFIVITIISWISTLLFFIASISNLFTRAKHFLWTHAAFYFLILFHFIFILLDEIFFQYQTEEGHILRLTCIIATYLLFILITRAQTSKQHSISI